ncbi:unnamed protein product [Urochloa humidicola]
MPGGAEQWLRSRRASCAAPNPGERAARQQIPAGQREDGGRWLCSYIDWIRFSLCDQMLARRCSRQLQN